MSELNDHSSRDHALLSASSAHRWLNCPPSAVAAEAYPPQNTEFTREGTLAHEVAEVVARARLNGYKVTVSEDGATGEMIECAEGYAEYIQEHIGTDATVLLEQRVDFSPWVPDGFGTADCIILQDGTMDVIDYKYGQGVAVSAEDNPQMMLYALGALNDFGIAYDVERIKTHIYQPRINNISVAEIRVTDLSDWAELTVRPIAQSAIWGEGEYKAGAWCKFCPHAGRCRELATTCVEYVNTHGLRFAVPVLSPYEVSEVLEMEPLISLWLKRVKDQALTTLMNGDDIPGYKVVEGRMGNRKWKDEIQVAEALKAAGYQLNDITETKLLSPAAMDKSIGRKKVAELLDNMIDRSPGAPTVVPEADKRPAYDRLAEAQEDFA